MKSSSVLIGLLLTWTTGSCCYGAAQVRSVAELDALKAQAHRSKRLVLLSVTSSDPGCWQCKKIGEQFLANREFTEWTERYAVFGEVDIAARGRPARDAMLATVYAAHGGDSLGAAFRQAGLLCRLKAEEHLGHGGSPFCPDQ
jgi:hypothetical protein